MKLLTLLVLILFSCTVSAQTKAKPFKWPKPIKDSTWSEFQCDTTYGVIEVMVGEGIIKADGIVTSCMYWSCSKNIYSPKDQAAMDSIGNLRTGNFVFTIGHSCSGIIDPTKTAYMKTSSGYKSVEGKFVFRPN